ncbi:hypothetical protein F7725_023705 [Dissostichus mawsoni]|uniref:Uncharacterized protein n=1 Tax=Dissostichus mawsoni TaxID=36200 RepID=A0A7J5XXA7_DISMA|nr:hypothetical protein F7725_023705 [Dissostichus mawsoni]
MVNLRAFISSPRLDLLIGDEPPVGVRGPGRQQGEEHRGRGPLLRGFGALGPAMSVRTQPGQQAFTRI